MKRIYLAKKGSHIFGAFSIEEKANNYIEKLKEKGMGNNIKWGFEIQVWIIDKEEC